MLAHLFDEYANLRPEDPCYIEIEDGGDGQSYCRKCLAKEFPGNDKWGSYGCAAEHDGCVHCASCGVLLDYVLTDAGADYELEHFRDVKFRRNKPLDRDTAFHLARLIAAKENDLDVIRIAARAIRCMRRIPKGTPT